MCYLLAIIALASIRVASTGLIQQMIENVIQESNGFIVDKDNFRLHYPSDTEESEIIKILDFLNEQAKITNATGLEPSQSGKTLESHYKCCHQQELQNEQKKKLASACYAVRLATHAIGLVAFKVTKGFTVKNDEGEKLGDMHVLLRDCHLRWKTKEGLAFDMSVHIAAESLKVEKAAESDREEVFFLFAKEKLIVGDERETGEDFVFVDSFTIKNGEVNFSRSLRDIIPLSYFESTGAVIPAE